MGWDGFRMRATRVPPATWAAVMIVAVVALAVAATSVEPIRRWDETAVRELQGEVALRGIEEHVFAVTDLAGSPMLLAALIVVAALLLVRRWRAALAVVLAVTLTKLTVAIVKALVERPRPDQAFESYGTFSFPSGHAASAAALYMTLAVLLSRGHRRGVRAAVIGGGALITIAVGVSRILLGAHHPTDVLAGWLVGGLLGLAAWVLVVRVAGQPRRAGDSSAGRVRDAVTAREASPPRIPDDARI